MKMTWDDRAEAIIKCQGLAFALAVSSGNEADMREARMYLKNAIVRALLDAVLAGDRSGGRT